MVFTFATLQVNTGGVGFYRVLYSTPLLDNLLPCISQMSPLDRLVVLNDLFALVCTSVFKCFFVFLVCLCAHVSTCLLACVFQKNLSEFGMNGSICILIL